MQRYSTFICNYYLPLFVSFYNSYKYYENKIPLHVYNYKRLNTFNIQYLKKYVDVTHLDINNHGNGDIYYGGYAFKYLALVNNMYEHEIILDVDANFLNNIDFLFDYLKDDKMILSREGELWNDIFLNAYYKSDNKEEETNKIKKYLNKHIGNLSDNITDDYNFKNYNAGLMGFSKSKHTDILNKSIEILYDREYPEMLPLTMEQTVLCFLMNLRQEIDRVVLPQKWWMNTWEYHQNPRKSIIIKDEKLQLIFDNNERINFYHYTGDIGANDINNNILSARLYFLTEEYFKFFTGQRIIEPKNINHLWFEKHQNPVLFIYEYFRNNGPAVAPKIYSLKFREDISKLLKVFYDEQCDNEDERVLIICLLYDYINLLNYKLVGNHKYYKILDIYLEGKINESTNTIGIDMADATVNLSLILDNNINYADWFYSIDPTQIKDIVFEKLGNVSIKTKTKDLNL
jgi:hypothetical protein